MPYLARKNGCFYLRLAVPRSLQTHWGKTEISFPLRTRDPLQAKIAALNLASQLLIRFGEIAAMARTQGDPPSVAEVMEHAARNGIKKFETATLPNGLPYLAKAEPGEDYSNGVRAVEAATKAAKLKPIRNAVEQAQENNARMLAQFSGIREKKHITAAVADYIAELVKRNHSSVRHIQNELEHFRDWILLKNKQMSVHSITKTHGEDYRKVLEAISNHKTKTKDGKLSQSTVLKRMSFVETFFRWCQDKEWFPDGDRRLPTYGNKPEKVDADERETSYEAFTADELKRIFDPATYVWKSPHQFWAPLLGALMGGRKGETVNIAVANIHNHNIEQVWTLTYKRATKNKNSMRTVPIHPTLIELGFLDYVADIRRFFGDGAVLFGYNEDMDKAYGGRFAAYLDKRGIISPRKVLHSFRKNVAETMKNNGAPINYEEHLIGHLPVNLHKNVYSGIDLPKTIYRLHIERTLFYPFLDFSPFKYKAGMFDNFLKHAKAAMARSEAENG